MKTTTERLLARLAKQKTTQINTRKKADRGKFCPYCPDEILIPSTVDGLEGCHACPGCLYTVGPDGRVVLETYEIEERAAIQEEHLYCPTCFERRIESTLDGVTEYTCKQCVVITETF